MLIKEAIGQIHHELGTTIENYSNSIEQAYINNTYDLIITAKIGLVGKEGKDTISNYIEFYPKPKTKSEKVTVVVGAHEQLSLPDKKNRATGNFVS